MKKNTKKFIKTEDYEERWRFTTSISLCCFTIGFALGLLLNSFI